MRQQLYLESRFGYSLPDGSALFWLQDPIVLPNPQAYQFTVAVPNASFPLTHYAIHAENRDLEIEIDGVTKFLQLPIGNHSIDELIEFLGAHDVEASYSENTNRISVAFNSTFKIGPKTTCQTLLGVRVGDEDSTGTYTAPRGVNLAGTSHFFVRSNLRTRNRDPVSLGFSSVLAKVPIERTFNGIQKYDAPFYSFAISERSIHYLIISILDEDLQPVVFHGGHWSITLEFDVVEAERYTPATDYRANFMALLSNNGQERGTEDPSPDKRSKQNTGGQQRATAANRNG